MYKEIKGQLSILSKSANATARHKIDSKLKTMRMKITENVGGGGGTASFYIFSKACYLRKDYAKLLEEIFPKPSAHSWQSFFPSISRKTNTTCDFEQMWKGIEVCEKKYFPVSFHVDVAQWSLYCDFIQCVLPFDIKPFSSVSLPWIIPFKVLALKELEVRSQRTGFTLNKKSSAQISFNTIHIKMPLKVIKTNLGVCVDISKSTYKGKEKMTKTRQNAYSDARSSLRAEQSQMSQHQHMAISCFIYRVQNLSLVC